MAAVSLFEQLRGAPAAGPGAGGDADTGKAKDKAKRKEAPQDRRKAVFVSGLPTAFSEDDLRELCSETGPVRHCFLVKDGHGASRGLGFVFYTTRQHAESAVHMLSGRTVDGKRIKVAMALQRKDKDQEKDSAAAGGQATDEQARGKRKRDGAGAGPSKKSFRLIVRNLSFKVSEKKLREEFGKFGVVEEASIPKNDRGPRGFAFVQMATKDAANKAKQKLNASALMGRPIAVDWALSKDFFVRQRDEAAAAGDDATDDEDEEGSDDAEDDGDDMDDADDSDDDGDDDDGDDDDGDDDDDDLSEDDLSADEDDDAADEDDDPPPKRQKRQESLETTVFVRNLPFDAMDEDLEELFERFGRVRFGRVVVDKVTGRPRGTGFVKFYDPEAAMAAIEQAAKDPVEEMLDDDDLVQISGRRLTVTSAVSRDEASSINAKEAKKRERQKEDKRNLYLAREGLIMAGTDAAEGVSATDLSKRAAAEQQKRTKLKNPNMVVSRTRLSIRNLPPKMDESELRQVLRKHIGVKYKIVQLKILRDSARVDASGQPRSKGFGFVEFSKHPEALGTLRKINNNPHVFTPDRRPIVEFAIDDQRALLKLRRIKERGALAAAKRAEAAAQNGQDAEQHEQHEQGKSPSKKPERQNKKERRGKKEAKQAPTQAQAQAKDTKPSRKSTKAEKRAAKKAAQRASRTPDDYVDELARKGLKDLERKRARQGGDGAQKKARDAGKKRPAGDDFDDMVARYKKRIFGQ